MPSNPAHDEAKFKEVAEDVVTSDICTAVEVVRVGAPEEADVVELEDEGDYPVDGGNDGIQGKWRVVHMVLAPDRPIVRMMMTVLRSVEGVVGSCHNNQQPRDDGEDLVCIQVGAREF